MGKIHERLNKEFIEFIKAQRIFFVATAPLEGRISLSPKGYDSFRVLDESRVAFLNLTGSGNETAAHLLENGRITVMFCSFEKTPLILRLYGTGRAIHEYDVDWNTYAGLFPASGGMRQIILIKIESVQSSCGEGVPFFTYEGERDSLKKWIDQKGEDGNRKYWREKNQKSIDGLPTNVLN